MVVAASQAAVVAATDRIAVALARAACTLLGITAAELATARTWDLDLGVLSYAERERTFGVELLLDANTTLDDDDESTLGLEIDTLTGATPNGATASDVAQTFTQSSGSGTYTSSANELPVDDTHMDTRLAGSANYKDRRTRKFAIDYGARVSMEFDYLSLGANNGFQYEFNQKNTRVDLGFNAEYNRVHPVGNVPDPLAEMTPPDSIQNRGDASVSRDALEVGLGLTQVLDRHSLVQARFTVSRFSGYLNDPYKIISVIENENDARLGETLRYVFEARPDSRQLNTLYLAWKRNLTQGVIDLSARGSRDDWGMSSVALDLQYRHALADGQ